MYLSHQYRIITGTHTSVYPPTYYKRHNNGLRFPVGDIYVKSTNLWFVKSQTNRDVLYEIKKFAETCSDNDQCYCRCIKQACLSLCMHLYTCECSDNHALCKHIHKIHSLIVRQIPSFENIFSDNKITEDVECIPDSVSSVTLVESGIDSSVEETCDDERKIQETELLLDLNRFLETGSAGRRLGQGRRRETTPNEDRYLVLTARRHRNKNAILLQHLPSATGTTVSTQTVRNHVD
ncbi:transposable element Tcb2 transposase [Trichonephila clavipes]|nr:transposable element Tcb2 transposase [Trichonephila clavipes]